LTVAQQLARLGYAVTVFERSDRPGGLLRYGIPDFKMEKRLIDRRLAQLEEEGVRFRTGVDVGRDVSLASLQAEFDAICLAIGAEQARDLEVPGRELAGVYPAMDYLTRQNRVLAGLPVEHKISAAGLKVAILGGGDTGADCLGTAIRQGCKDVLQLELTGKPPLARDAGRPWPLLPMTLTTSPAHEEGGRRRWNVATTGLSGRDGRVEWLHGVELRQEGGRLKPLPGSEFTLPVDLVLLAIGFTGVAASFPAGQEGLARTPVGTLSTDGSYMTSVPGIFAAGDARRGASLIVWAIAEGRKAAAAIDRYLQGGGGTRH
jgi:glutamate synthase (NADPH/NADH) small chain